MADLQQQIDEARKQGYSEQEITGYLQKQRPELAPKIKEAIDTGYDASDILRHLAPPAAAPSLLQDIGTSFQNFGRDVGSAVYGASATANRMVANLAQGAEGLLEKYARVDTPLRDLGQWARGQQQAQQAEAQRLAGGRNDLASQINRGLTQGVLELPQYAVAAHVAGPVAGMAAIGAITEGDKGWQAALEAAASGALTGGALHVMGPASQPIRLTGAAAMTYAQARLQGADHETALAHATTMGLMAGHAPGGLTAREFVPGLDTAIKATGAGARAAAPDVAKGSAKVLAAYGISNLPVPDALKIGFGAPTAAVGARQINRGLRKGMAAARASMAETAPAETARPGERTAAGPAEAEVPPVNPEEAAAPTTQAVGTLEYNAPTAAEFEAAATRPADVGRMAPAEALADFEQRRATRTQGQPPTPGQQFAESQGYDWAKLSPDDRLALEQIAEAQANMAAQNLEVPPQPPVPAAPAEPRTLADLIPETEMESQLAESIRQAQAGKPTAAEVPPPPAAPVQKAENIFAKNARLAKAVRVADAAQEAGLKSGDIFRMSPAEFAEKVGEKSISADTMAMVVDKLRRLESQAPPAAPAPAPAKPKSTPPAASVRKARAKKKTLKDLMQPD